MNKNAAIINLPVKQKTTNHNTAIISYLNERYGNNQTAYSYKEEYKDYITAETAAVFFIQSPLDKKMNRFFKRSIDILLSVIIIAGVLSWLIPLLAIIIKVNSKGPVFFLQKRNKQNGMVFTCIKFRSMVVNKEADILPAKENDTRITVIGKMMRRTFIDELPQFFNVLWGDMSVVGPRPHMLREHLKFESLVPHYNFRNNVKPGITGLSQVTGLEGAANTILKMNNRVIVDNFYIRNWSFKMDIIIMFRTLSKFIGL